MGWHGFRFWVSGFGFRVSDFGYRVWDSIGRQGIVRTLNPKPEVCAGEGEVLVGHFGKEKLKLEASLEDAALVIIPRYVDVRFGKDLAGFGFQVSGFGF